MPHLRINIIINYERISVIRLPTHKQSSMATLRGLRT